MPAPSGLAKWNYEDLGQQFQPRQAREGGQHLKMRGEVGVGGQKVTGWYAEVCGEGIPATEQLRESLSAASMAPSEQPCGF